VGAAESAKSTWEGVIKWGTYDAIEFPDPAGADNYLAEHAVIQFLQAASSLAAKLVEISAENEVHKEKYRVLHEQATVAYVHALNGDSEKVVKILDKVID
jgi:hypothetical protein